MTYQINSIHALLALLNYFHNYTPTYAANGISTCSLDRPDTSHIIMIDRRSLRDVGLRYTRWVHAGHEAPWNEYKYQEAKDEESEGLEFSNPPESSHISKPPLSSR